MRLSTSFGHFTSGFFFRVFTIALASANEAAKGKSVTSETSNFGCKITENHSPPSGETHLRPNRPLPLDCFFETITVPFSLGVLEIDVAKFCVESILSK